jgi:hypothetical protein
MRTGVQLSSPRRAWVAGFSIPLLIVARISAQPTEVHHRVACANCAIAITPLVRLGAPSDPVSPAVGLEVSQDSRGRYFVVAEDRASLAIYDRAGHYVARVGRKGQGPGEFGRGVRAFGVGLGDSLYVADAQQRLTVFAADLKFARSVALPGAADGASFLENGSIILSRSIPSADRVGIPYHLVNAAGVFQRSFGPEQDVTPTSPAVYPRPVLSVDGKTVWAMYPDFSFRAWSTSGQSLAEIKVVDHPWGVTPPVKLPDLRGVTSPRERAKRLSAALHSDVRRTRVSIAGIDDAGRLWLNVLVPNDKDNSDDLFLEVIDSARGELLVSQRVTTRLISLFRGAAGLMGATVSEGPDGLPVLDVWRVEMVRR